MSLLLTPSERLHCSRGCAAAQPRLSVRKNLIRERGGENRRLLVAQSLLFSSINMPRTSLTVTRLAFTPIDISAKQRRAVFQGGQAQARAHLIFTYLVLDL